MISSMTDDERRHPERFIVTSWEEIVDGGKRKKKRSAFYDTSRLRRVAQGSGHKEQEVADLLNRFGDDAPDDDADRDVDRSAGQDPRLQAAGAGQEADGHGHEPAGQHDADAVGRAGDVPGPKRNVDRGKEKRKRKDARKARKKNRR